MNVYSRRQSFGLLLAAGIEPRGKTNCGPAFHYQAIFSRESEAWYTRFPILVTGGILGEKQSRNLKARNTKLIAYSWSSAFYPGDAASAPSDWQAKVLSHRGSWLLNAEPLGGGAAASGRVAEWYDFGNPDLIAARARDMADRLSAAGYDGFFFDTLGFEQLPEPMRREFRSRHPGMDYDAAQGGFLRELRDRLPSGKLIFTNQGYRRPASFLPAADMDLSESYFTALGPDGGTILRKWHDPQAPWESIKTPMEKLIDPASRAFPNVRFVHLNYASGNSDTVRRAISYSYACAKLFGHDAYLVTPGSEAAERDEIYFSDLGAPASDVYRETPDGNAVWREYQKGIVAINCGNRAAVVGPQRLSLTDPPRGYVFR